MENIKQINVRYYFEFPKVESEDILKEYLSEKYPEAIVNVIGTKRGDDNDLEVIVRYEEEDIVICTGSEEYNLVNNDINYFYQNSFAKEINRRFEEYRKNPSVSIPSDELWNEFVNKFDLN
jgi:hypothetical protein